MITTLILYKIKKENQIYYKIQLSLLFALKLFTLTGFLVV